MNRREAIAQAVVAVLGAAFGFFRKPNPDYKARVYWDDDEGHGHGSWVSSHRGETFEEFYVRMKREGARKNKRVWAASREADGDFGGIDVFIM